MIKLNRYYNFFILFFFIFILLKSTFLGATDNIKEKVKDLSIKLRCMTCQNQSIYDSDSEFSKNIKQIIEKKFKEGKKESEIILLLTERYGEYISFKPLINKKNIFLWLFPFILVLISIVFFIKFIKNSDSE